MSRLGVIGAGVAIAALSSIDWSGSASDPGEGHKRAQERERQKREALADIPVPDGETRQQRRARERRSAKRGASA